MLSSLGRCEPFPPAKLAWFAEGKPVSSPEQYSRAPGWLFDIGDEILPNYMGSIISQYKHPYKPISIMECHKGLNAAHLQFSCRFFVFK